MQKNYYAIIPANVRYDNDLTANAKLLYGEITALCNEKGYCWAGNSYFAELYQKDKSTITRWLKQLEDKGYIVREFVYKEGSLEIENRYMRICSEGMEKIATTPTGKNKRVNNTSFNITINNFVEIVTYLNIATGKSFKPSSRKTKDLIKARQNEGYTLDDFKQVIDIKCSQWLNDPNMVNYLRPETLFGTKFESYLNEKPATKNLSREDFDLSD